MPTLRAPLAVILLAVNLVAVASSIARAQQPGDILWSTPLEVTAGGTHSRAVLGPDGTVYVLVEDLFSINLDGTLRWRAPVNSLSVSTVATGAGRVYVSADYGPEKFVIAYDAADGAEVWRTEIAATSAAHYGPSVGPDGDLYGVIGGLASGLGAFSLATIDGSLQWNEQGFTDEGVSVKSHDIPFGTDRLFIADRGVPCSPAGWGLTALGLDGEVLWCIPGHVQFRPDVGPDGAVYGAGFDVLRKFNPDGGEELWAFAFPPPVGDLDPPTLGPDGTVYIPETPDLWALDSDGNVRYRVQGVGPATGRVTVSDDGSVLLYPAGGNERAVIALDPADGSELWRTELPYAPDGPLTLSADETVAYVAHWGGPDAPSELVALYVGGSGGSTDGELSAALPGDPAVSAAFPNPFHRSARLKLNLPDAQTVTAVAYDAIGRRVAVLHEGPLAAGDHTIVFEAAGLPSGLYLVRVAGATFSALRRVALIR